jgi:predicted dehydrogenase/threonine dehydrogenase-like Zn-dependent dehydrogenase
MKQIIQNIRTGKTSLEEVPVPMLRKGTVLIRTTKTLVSAGTERMIVAFGKANLIKKLFLDTSRTREVIRMMRQKGLVNTLKAVSVKLDESIALGYSNVGVVVGVGEGVLDLKLGDRVVNNGPHAEFVCVPRNLVAMIPADVPDTDAAFTIMGAIALNGIRLLKPNLGEVVVVVGLGLLGLLTAKLLLINGCKVIGIDQEPAQLVRAEAMGVICFNIHAVQVDHYILLETNNLGADGVIITTSTRSQGLLSLACRVLKMRGTIVLVGVVGMHLDRAAMYHKEVSLKVARSYGPGRYDPTYEEEGQDYPFSFVRWTENRNFQAILALLQNKSLIVQDLITDIHPFENYAQVYGRLASGQSAIILFEYGKTESLQHTILLRPSTYNSGQGIIAIIGAGNFVSRTLMPILKKENVKYIISERGVSAIGLAKKYAVGFAGSDYKVVFQDPDVEGVIIATRHHLHAPILLHALQFPKHLFVEKPLCIFPHELKALQNAWPDSLALSLQVGFNRRFAPLAQQMKTLLGGAPMQVTTTMNAGHISVDSWIHHPEKGGGRILGEACHHIDLVGYLTGSKACAVFMNGMGLDTSVDTDNATILIQYENGSTGVINYFSNGNIAYQKERIEVYSEGRTLILDDFKKLKGYGFNKLSHRWMWQDKGHKHQFKSFMEKIKTGESTQGDSFDQMINTTNVGFAALESLHKGTWIMI